MNPRSIRFAALLIAVLTTAVVTTAIGGVRAAQADESGSAARSQRPIVGLQPIRAEWPIVREASGRWVVSGEAMARSLRLQSVRVRTVGLRVFDRQGRVLATQVFEGPRELRGMLGVITFDAQGNASRKPDGTTVLAPGDLAVALLGTLAGYGPLKPHRAEISVAFTTGPPAKVTVPLVAFDAGQQMSWPLSFASGRPWRVHNTFSPADPFPEHRTALLLTPDDAFISQRFAIDCVQVDERGQTANPQPSPQKESYYAWGADILSAGSGNVVAVVADQPDQEIGVEDASHPAGNYVVVQHGPRVFSVYAHMMQGSAVVGVGDSVASGQALGRVGNSGNTTEPHLHFHFMDRWDGLDPVISFFTSQGIPAVFWNANVRRGNRTLALQGTTPLSLDLIEP